MSAHPETYSPVLKTLIANRMEREKTLKPKMATALMEGSEPPYIPKGVNPPKLKAQQLKSFLQKPKK